MDNNNKSTSLFNNLDEVINITQELKMKIIYRDQPTEVYENIKKSRGFKQLEARCNSYIDLFYDSNFKNTISDIPYPEFCILATKYLRKKLQKNKSFCFLIAPQDNFEMYKQKIYAIQSKLE